MSPVQKNELLRQYNKKSDIQILTHDICKKKKKKKKKPIQSLDNCKKIAEIASCHQTAGKRLFKCLQNACHLPLAD